MLLGSYIFVIFRYHYSLYGMYIFEVFAIYLVVQQDLLGLNYIRKYFYLAIIDLILLLAAFALFIIFVFSVFILYYGYERISKKSAYILQIYLGITLWVSIFMQIFIRYEYFVVSNDYCKLPNKRSFLSFLQLLSTVYACKNFICVCYY